MSDDDKPGLTVAIVGTGRSAVETLSGLSGNLGPLPASDPSGDVVGLAPTMEGPRGRAWSVAPERVWAAHGGEEDGQVANWVIEAPWAHPAWHSYWLALVHLRPFPGMVGGTRVYLQGATHEVWLYALDPRTPRRDFIERLEPPALLTPKNFAAQLREPGDAIAAARVESAVREVVEGRLNPDTDAISQWAARFGDNMLKDRPGGSKPRFIPNVVK